MLDRSIVKVTFIPIDEGLFCSQNIFCDGFDRYGERSICSCGMGKVGTEFHKLFIGVPFISQLTRVAISPIFAPAYVESTRTMMDALAQGTVDKLDVFQYLGAITDDLNVENLDQKFRCKVCGKGNAKKCSKCMKTRYCSKECQAKDWNVHKIYCKRQVSK